MYYNLKSLIKAIRATKTLSDERALITKESADIRTSFKTPTTTLTTASGSSLAPYLNIAAGVAGINTPADLHNNIAKLLYIHMLGYPAHFGQIECLKLVAGAGGGGSATGGGPGGAKFADKRLGYLGVGVLLDEKQEVLTLVTNSLKNDMNHHNMYVVGLALCIFTNIASEEMARDLVNEIEKLLGSSNTYIRKKAALCALRVVKRVPELIDHFIPRITSLLSDRNHGVLLCGVTLVTEMCKIDENVAREFGGAEKAVPILVKHLKALVSTGYSPEHDVSGITDPFLQVKILRLLRILGKGDVEASEAMNDILASVAQNTDSSKNVGNAILYETTLTILDIEADSGLRVMAINILGKFLSNRDNNIRYVALNTLNKVVAIDNQAVQRHRSIILDCLRDGDISIRRRALELSYALIKEDNVRVLTRELLAFLEVADNEFKLGMTTQICLAAERYAPNKRWHIDTVLRVLKLAGNYVREEVISSFIRLVTHTPELQLYTVQKLYAALKADVSQEALTICGLWVMGEFGEILLQAGTYEEDEQQKEVRESDVMDLVETIVGSPYSNPMIRQYGVMTVTKLSTRFSSDPVQLNRIKAILSKYETSLEVELQQRSVEFEHLLNLDSLRVGLLERMPPPELKATVMGTVSEKRDVGSTKRTKDTVDDLIGDEIAPTSQQPSGPSNQDLLADIFGGGDNSASPPPAAAPPTSTIDDILGLFGPGQPAQSPAATLPVQSPPMGGAPVNLFDSSPAPAASRPPQPPAQPQMQSFTAYENNGLRISLTPQRNRNQPDLVLVLAQFTAVGGQPLGNINFQAAVPKNQKLAMSPISNPNVNPGATETQQMRIQAPGGTNVRLRLRIAFVAGGQQIQDQTDFAFPEGSV
ncbi:Adaptor protein complex AP-1 gamma subunit [Atractiella rhizophila]|nr:Adaptor protein complex AP-1 gamma subunit [Atractiella rhizophila]